MRALPGIVMKHFTARDIISGWNVLEAHSRASSHITSGFIDVPVKANAFHYQSYSGGWGSEFQDAFKRVPEKRYKAIRLTITHLSLVAMWKEHKSGSLSNCVETATRWHKAQEHFSPINLYIS